MKASDSLLLVIVCVCVFSVPPLFPPPLPPSPPLWLCILISSFRFLPGHSSSHELSYDRSARVVFLVYWRSSVSRCCAGHAVVRFSGRALLLLLLLLSFQKK